MASLNEALQAAVGEHQAGRLENAAKIYERILAAVPDQADALNLRGVVAAQCGQNEVAVGYLARALEQRPAWAECHNNLAAAYLQLDQTEHATRHLETALKLRPEYADALNNRLKLERRLGRLAAAIDTCRLLVQLKPDDAILHNSLGELCTHLGRFEEAQQHFRDALDRDPGFVSAYSGLLTIESYSLPESDIARLEQLARRMDLAKHQRVLAHFALGRSYERAGAFDQAFQWYAAGNRLKEVSFDSIAHAKYVEDLIAVFDRDRCGPHRIAGSSSSLPIFIVGMPRSGTTLVEQILSSHPQISAGGERRDVGQLAESIPKLLNRPDAYPRAAAALEQDHVTKLAVRYLDLVREPAQQAVRFTNKLPATFHHLGLIALMFPGAYVIHCRRHPLDTCLSCYFQNFVEVAYSFDLQTLGTYYREYEKLWSHWDRVLPLQVFTLRYEELINDPESTIRQLIEYCDVPWDERCLDHTLNTRPVETASAWQVRQNMHTRSIQRWKKYEDSLGPLLSALGWDAAERRIRGEAENKS